MARPTGFEPVNERLKTLILGHFLNFVLHFVLHFVKKRIYLV